MGTSFRTRLCFLFNVSVDVPVQGLISEELQYFGGGNF